MEKKRIFRIMANTDREKINRISKIVSDNHKIIIIKEPSKTLTMIKMREPVKNSLFFIGEVMVSEAIVDIDGVKGMAVTMGDDFEKVLSMAIIDAAINSKLNLVEDILEEFEMLEKKQNIKREKENALHLKTMVNFDTMIGGEA